MNVLYCGDENIEKGVLMSVMSILSHLKETLNVFILTADVQTTEKKYTALSPDFAELLDRVVKKQNEQNSVTLFDITDEFAAELPLANTNTRFTPCCMLRLFADKIDTLPSRILYLDNDVICHGDFSLLSSLDMDGCAIAGVPDRYGKWFFGNPLAHDYLNSGVLLIDLEKIRTRKIFDKCRQLCREKKMFMPDQSAINRLAGRKKTLEKRYNEQTKIKADTVFRHYTTYFKFLPFFHSVTVKPWDKDKLHKTLSLFEYDRLIEAADEIIKKQQTKETV